MIKCNSTLVAITSLAIVSSCTPKKVVQETVPTPVEIPIAEMVKEEVKARPHYNYTETRYNDLLHTKLDVRFDWNNRQLNGKAYLKFKPYFHPTNKLVLDAKAMDIHKVKLGAEGEELKFEYDGAFLEVTLPKSYTRKEEYPVYIEYTANPEKVTQEGSQAISDAKGLYFINHDGSNPNQHMEIWTQGETEASSVWFPTIDAPNEKTTQEMYITVKDKYVTLSNGALMSQTPNDDGTRTDYWKMDKPHTPYLFMMAVGDFKIVKDTWKKANGEEMPVHYYVEEKFEPHARAIFGKTPKMLSYFSELLGVEYPWPKYHQVVVREYVSGAMENTSATIHGDFLYQTTRELIDGGNESIIAHELFHHWFGDLVTCESWSNLPLNESFANYSQYLWDEYEYGKDEAAMNAFGEMEGYFLSAEQGGHVDMIRFDYANKEEMFDGHSYNKGGRILHMLRTYLGDDAFFEALRLYLTEHAYQAAEIHDLRMAFEAISGEDLNWFFDQWFLASGHPVLKFEQEYANGVLKLKISQNQQKKHPEWPLYRLPINVDFYHNGKVKREQIWLEKSEQEWEFPMEQPDFVNVDGDKVLLAKKVDKKSIDQWIAQLNHAPLWLDKKEAIAKVNKKDTPEAMDAMMGCLDNEFWNVRSMAIQKIGKVAKKRPDAVKTKLKSLVASDAHPKVRARAMQALNKHFPSDNSLNDVYADALKDSSYQVIASALKTLSKSDPKRGFQLAKDYESLESSAVNAAIASIYAEMGGAEEHAYFLKNAEEITGFNKYQFVQTYHKYLMRQEDQEIKKGIEVYKSVAQGEGFWFVRLSGYQLLGDVEKHYRTKASELGEKVKSLEAESKTDEASLTLRAQKEAEKMADEVKSELDELKSKETDENVKKYLGL